LAVSGKNEREVAVDGWEFGWSGVARLTELLLIKDVEVNFGDEDFLAQLADGGQFGVDLSRTGRWSRR